MIDIILLYLFGIVVSCVVLWYVVNFKYLFHLRWIPGPTPLPLVGNGHELTSPTEYLAKLMDYHRKYGNFYKLFLGFQQPTIVSTDRDFYKFIYSSHEFLDKAYFYSFSHPWLKTGLITSTGLKWKNRRRMINPAFSFNALESFVDIFEKKSDILMEKLRGYADGPTFDIFPCLTRCSLDIIAEAAMGLNINSQNNTQNEYIEKVDDMRNVVMARLFKPWLHYDFLYVFSNTYRVQTNALKVLENTTQMIIDQKRQEMKLSNDVNTADNHDALGVKKKRIFIDILLNSTIDGKPLADEDIQEEVASFVFAGHDTTSSALSFTTHLLSKHPDVQQRAFEEIRSVIPNGKKISFSDLQELKYLDAVIKEVLRVYSIGPFIGREAHKDIIYGRKTIPKGTQLLFLLQAINNDPNNFPEPEKFDPDRFLVNGDQMDPYTYVPFSSGPRNCIGQKFAQTEMKVVLSKLLQHYEILPAVPDHSLILSSEWVLKSANGFKVRLAKRKD